MRCALVALLFLCAACRSREPQTSLPVLQTIPDFHLVDQDGHEFGLAQMNHHVWVANFIFTRCPSICPTFTAQMGALEKDARAKNVPVQFMSFSVDPGHDSPEVLRAWAKEHAVDWTLLTGTVDQIQAAVVGGLKIAAKPVGPDDDLASVFHGTHFVVIDGAGHIRGYYDSSEPARVDRIVPDAALIAAEVDRR